MRLNSRSDWSPLGLGFQSFLASPLHRQKALTPHRTPRRLPACSFITTGLTLIRGLVKTGKTPPERVSLFSAVRCVWLSFICALCTFPFQKFIRNQTVRKVIPNRGEALTSQTSFFTPKTHTLSTCRSNSLQPPSNSPGAFRKPMISHSDDMEIARIAQHYEKEDGTSPQSMKSKHKSFQIHGLERGLKIADEYPGTLRERIESVSV